MRCDATTSARSSGGLLRRSPVRLVVGGTEAPERDPKGRPRGGGGLLARARNDFRRDCAYPGKRNASPRRRNNRHAPGCKVAVAPMHTICCDNFLASVCLLDA